MSGVPINEVKVGNTSVYVRREDLYIDQLPDGIDLRGVEFDISQIGVDPPQTGRARGILSYLSTAYPQNELYYVCKRLNPRTVSTCRLLAYYARILGKRVEFICDEQAMKDFSRPVNKDLLNYLRQLNCSIEKWGNKYDLGKLFDDRVFRAAEPTRILVEITNMCGGGLLLLPDKSTITTVVVPVQNGDTIAGIISGLMLYDVHNVRVVGILTNYGLSWGKDARRVICSKVVRLFATPWCMQYVSLFPYYQTVPIKQVAVECPFPTYSLSGLRAWSMLVHSPLADKYLNPRTLFWNTGA